MDKCRKKYFILFKVLKYLFFLLTILNVCVVISEDSDLGLIIRLTSLLLALGCGIITAALS